jgi:hypothetical protein
MRTYASTERISPTFKNTRAKLRLANLDYSDPSQEGHRKPAYEPLQPPLTLLGAQKPQREKAGAQKTAATIAAQPRPILERQTDFEPL